MIGSKAIRFFPSAALLALSPALLSGCGSSQEADPSRGEEASLRNVAAVFQSISALDYEPLAAEGSSLEDVARQSDVVGAGRIVDVRLGYTETIGGGEASELQHMLIVVEPDRVTTGTDLLGQSGRVFVDQAAPPIDAETGTRHVEELRAEAVASQERVAFMLDRVPDGALDNPTDEFEGRSKDDPLLWATHPASFLAADEAEKVAYPLLVDESIQTTDENLRPVHDLGIDVERFGPPSGDLATTQY